MIGHDLIPLKDDESKYWIIAQPSPILLLKVNSVDILYFSSGQQIPKPTISFFPYPKTPKNTPEPHYSSFVTHSFITLNTGTVVYL